MDTRYSPRRNEIDEVAGPPAAVAGQAERKQADAGDHTDPEQRQVQTPPPGFRQRGVNPVASARTAQDRTDVARPQAALTSERNRVTWPARSLDCEASCSAAPSTLVAAEPVSSAARCTPVMFELTSWVPRAASCTLREISWVAEPCCSIAEAIATPIWSISVM